MKKISLLLAAVMLGSVLAACGGTGNTAGSSASKPADGGSSATTGQNIAVNIGPNPETMDPALNSASDAGSTITHLFEGLLVDTTGETLQPGQAKELPTVSEDGLVYTFTLRDGLKWSDGTPLTAADFEYSWKRAVAAETAAPYAELFKVIAGFEEANAGDGSALQVKAVDDTTLEVTLSAPCAFFNELVANPSYSPVPKAMIEKYGDTWATKAETYIGNGAFKVTEWVPNGYILCSKNENYWDAANIKLNSIKFLLIEDANAALSAYENGTILLCYTLPADEIAGMQQRDDFFSEPKQGVSYVTFNTQKAPFNDARVRKALSLAIDRDYIANTVMPGVSKVATSFVCPGVSDAAPGSSFVEVGQKRNGGKPLLDTKPNIAEAKALLAEAGYDENHPLKTTYSTNDAGYNVPVAEALQQMWKEVNVEMDINIMEWASFGAARRNGDYEVARDAWGNDYSDPSSVLDLLITTNGNNNSKYANPEYDALMKEAAATVDNTKRMELLHKAEEMLLKDAVVAPIVFSTDYFLMSPELKGFHHSTLGHFYFMHCYLDEA